MRPIAFQTFLTVGLFALAASPLLGGSYSPNHGSRHARPEALSSAMRRLVKRAQAGDANAADDLGRAYERGAGIERNNAAALRWFRKAAAGGNASAMLSLAGDYEAGRRGVVHNRHLAELWYQRGAKAAQAGAARGDARAENSLGWLYAHGRGGIPRNLAQAARYFRRAAAQDNADAITNLGWMYAEGWIGGAQNDSQAIPLFRKAALAGNDIAQNDLALAYLHGKDGLRVDNAKGLRWLKIALAQNSNAALNTMGELYQYGEGGLRQDEIRAEGYFLRAAHNGDDIAENNLAWLYLTAKDPREHKPAAALTWARRAVAGERDNDNNWDTLADAYFQSGRLRAAVRAEERALALATPADKAGFSKSLKKYQAAEKKH